MDIVKKNLVSIICGVVALLAIVVWLVPVRSMLASQQTQLNENKSQYDKLVQIERKPRKLPVVTLAGGAPAAPGAAAGGGGGDDAGAPPLPGFPNAKLVEQGEEVMKQVQAGSAKVLQRAVEINRHTQLLEGVLPRVDNVMALTFRDRYLRMLGYPSDPLRTSVLAQEVLHAGTPPTLDEIQQRAFELWKNDYVNKVWALNQQAQNLQEVTQEFAERVRTLPQEVRQEAAQKYKIYMDPDAFTRSPAITPESNPNPADVWFAQVGLWIQQDVCEAINQINTGSNSVLDAPIKHLRHITMPVGADLFGIDPQAISTTVGATSGGSRSSGAVGSSPNYAAGSRNPYGTNSSPYATAPRTPAAAEGTAPATPNTKDYKRSPTGRVSNPLYDVIPFTVVVRVDARKIPQVLRDLELNRFFTIHQVNAAIIDTGAAMKHDGFVYGNEDASGQTVAAPIEAPTTRPAAGGPATRPSGGGGDATATVAGDATPKGVPVPVAELTIQCEALLLRAWTTPLMPAEVKKALKIEEKPAEGTTPVAANQ